MIGLTPVYKIFLLKELSNSFKKYMITCFKLFKANN